MDAFEYLSVLISIVLGLALTQLLTSAGRLIQVRERVIAWWPVLVWIASLLLIIVQSWWALFEYRDHASWTLLEFALILAHPTVLFLMCVLLLPDADREGPIDLKANYFAQKAWFFSGAVGVVLLSLARPLVFDGEFPFDPDRVFQIAFLVTAVACMFSRRERVHKLVALTVPASLLAYVGLLFFRLA